MLAPAPGRAQSPAHVAVLVVMGADVTDLELRFPAGSIGGRQSWRPSASRSLSAALRSDGGT